MSLLKVITKASTNSNQITSESKYPIILNPDSILLNLKPKSEDSNDDALVKRVEGWKISLTDSEIIELSQKFFNKLKRSLKNHIAFRMEEFVSMLDSYLLKCGEKVGISVGVDHSDKDYTKKLVAKLGFLMGRDLSGLILEACIILEMWDLLETLIVHELVQHSCSSTLVHNLIDKRRSDLVCLCVKHVSDLQTSDTLSILKYFLSTPRDAYGSMAGSRMEWETQALLAIEMFTSKTLSGKELSLAKEASILLVVAHDDFSLPELCLHYLVASSNIDDVILSSCVGKLEGSEMMGLLKYLGKWLKKYERFPQVGPCPNAPSLLGLKACKWVPTLEAIVKWIGMVVDEHFSSLALHPEFHERLRSIEEVVSSLAPEARFCCSLSNLLDNLRR